MCLAEHGRRYLIGITDSAPILNDRLLLEGFTPFVSGDITKRTDPSRVFPYAQSIVVVCAPYGGGKFYSNLSSLGVCDDYHKKVKAILQAKAAELAEAFASFKHKILVDSPTLCERSLAARAGLCFFGKNGLCFSPEFGSRFNIGLMLTNIPVQAIEIICRAWAKPAAGRASQAPAENASACEHDCNLCIKACPNRALAEGKPLNANLCISYLTQKKELSADEEKLLHGQLYGCDICQSICPKNAKHAAHHLNPMHVLKLSDEELAEKFGHTAMNWKLDLLRRNAKLCALYKSRGFSH